MEDLASMLERKLPDAQIELIRPRDPDGRWMLDVERDGWLVVVAWAPKRGFAITSRAIDEDPIAYGTGADEAYPGEGPAEIAARVEIVLKEKKTTTAPRAVALRDLRARLNLSQVEMAKRVEVTQGALSKLERRGDMSIAVLARIVKAMGGDLELWVRFPDESPVRLLHSREGEGARTREKAS
jgi:DNA-binding XRE family transcriptional regulator